MGNERRGILALLADGKISARDAERLLTAWDAGDDWVWFAAAFLVFCFAGHTWHWPLREFAHAAEGLRVVASAVLHHLANV